MKNTMMKKLALFGGSSIAAGQAAAYEWTAVIAGIDFSGELAAIGAIVGLVAAVYVTIKGGKIVLGMLR